MPIEERHRRMHRMRTAVEANNVYRWAGKLLQALSCVDRPEQANDAFAARAAVLV
jgi:trehalose-6-phosphate synthase